jgi:precorrin-2 dehydrogenase/sirohydrochlorin ferrochelatase
VIPINLDPANTRVALMGRDQLALRRLQWLRDGGASPDVWSDAPSAGLSAAADVRQGAPQAEELAAYHAIWIADLPDGLATSIAQAARAAGVLVNVEDRTALCDFHTPAVVRRGQLTLTSATGGASPAVARAAREQLEKAFPPAWADALDDIAQARVRLRNANASFNTLIADARARLAQHELI